MEQFKLDLELANNSELKFGSPHFKQYQETLCRLSNTADLIKRHFWWNQMLHESQATEGWRQVHCLLQIPHGKRFFFDFELGLGGPGFLSIFPERMRSKF